ncbi:DNA cytosine methyltransferase [Parapedobacter sp. GCM10030251]|uniref:DNA cytosine methyltransferase n=1 Tax=Parapedobacter sp. GCM10030251 TaxID=3273419 RepID=UPI00361C898F
MKNKINIISLFSGGGFLDLGFMNQGFQVNEAVEFHQPFVDSYNYGLNNYVKKSQKEVYKKRIITHNKIETSLDATNKNTQKKLIDDYRDIAGIIGGPPCQDFSVGGKNAGVEGHRGKLIYTYRDIVNQVNPLFIFFENVAGLYRTKHHQSEFFNLKNELEKKYTLWFDIINALDYGIPQDRPRLALVGFRKDVIQKLIDNGFKYLSEPYEGHLNELVFKWPQRKYAKARQVLWPRKWDFQSEINEDEVKRIPQFYSSLLIKNAFSGLDNSTPNQLECFNPYSKKFSTVAEGDTSRKSFKRLHRYRYSPTVAYGNNEVHLHPTEPRRLSVREALRIQSVPDNYILPKEVSLTDKFKLISNGVPTRKAELIAQEIRRTLENYFSLA